MTIQTTEQHRAPDPPAHADSTDLSQPAAPPQRYYRPELDWLRLGAFSMVFVLHALPKDPMDYQMIGFPDLFSRYILVPLVQAGGYGVDLFFALSAFLITEILLREKAATGRVHIKSFYLRRILRIWPLYVTFILVVLPYEVFWKGLPVYYHIALLTFVGNWYIVILGGVGSLCGALWSVCIEEQFYITWPQLLGRFKQSHFMAIMTAIFAFTCLFRVVYIFTTPELSYAVWYHTLCRLDPFALGGILACLMHGRTIVLPAFLRFLVLFAALGSFWCVGNMPLGGYFGLYPAWTYPVVALGCVIFLFAFVTSPPRKSLNAFQRMLSYLGKISYGLYVFHLPMLAFVDEYLKSQWPILEWAWPIGVAVAASLTLALSMLSYEILEKPFLRLKRRFSYVESRPE